jgi:hypothetical protein
VLKGAFLTGALILLLVDVLAALWLAGRLRGMMRGTAAVLVLALGFASAPMPGAGAGSHGGFARRRARPGGDDGGGAGAMC